jgi:TIR domain
MKPAERIPLLKRLARSLAAINDEAEIDLILRQFGFRVEAVYEDDFYTYAMHQLEQSGNDDKRLELERYLEPAADDVAARPASSEPGPWKIPDSLRLFISHPHSLAPLAGAMRDWLGRYLIEGFVAHTDIEPSKKWAEVIESALLTCQAATALVTPEFGLSAWCDQEIGFCIARSICVVPLLYGDQEGHGFLGSFQGIKMGEVESNPMYAGWKAARRAMDALILRPDLKERMVPCIVRRYSESYSYDNTREMVPLLAKIPVESWTDDLVSEAERAASENNQVYDANFDGETVPAVVKRILAKVVTEQDFATDEDIPF